MLVLLILYYITYLLFVHVFFRLYCVERHKVIFGLDWKQSSKIGIMKWVDLPKQSLLWLVLLIIQTLNTLSVFSPSKFECFFNFFSLRKKFLLSLLILLFYNYRVTFISEYYSINISSMTGLKRISGQQRSIWHCKFFQVLTINHSCYTYHLLHSVHKLSL